MNANGKTAMTNESMHQLWSFFLEYWDDHITNPGDPHEEVNMNARTVRVLRSIYGRETVAQACAQWSRDGDIKVLGDSDLLKPDEACIRLFGYVNGSARHARRLA